MTQQDGCRYVACLANALQLYASRMRQVRQTAIGIICTPCSPFQEVVKPEFVLVLARGNEREPDETSVARLSYGGLMNS